MKQWETAKSKNLDTLQTNLLEHIATAEFNMNFNNNNNGESTHTDSNIISTNMNPHTENLCKCTSVKNHVTINFFDKEKSVCLNNRDDRCVINLSSYDLSEIDRSLLLKGLSFCPTPGEPSLQDLKKDLKAFFCRIQLRDYHWADNETDPTPHDQSRPTLDSFLNPNFNTDNGVDLSKFKLPSTWDPQPHEVDPAIETFCRAVLEDFKTFTPRSPRSQNLPKEEKRSLQYLKDHNIITVKPADKGSAVVIMGTCT